MYRTARQTARTTIIEYHAHDLLIEAFCLATLFTVFAIFAFDSLSTTTRSAWERTVLLLLGIVLAWMAGRTVYEQLRQLLPVRIVVDRARDAIVIGEHIVPLAEVRDVVVEEGIRRTLVCRKGKEDPPGFRIAIVLKDFDHIPATREWRPGPRAVHDDARARVLEAMDRVT